jgi:acid phosphatase (class A)
VPKGNHAYPSGHALRGTAAACVLAEIFRPEAPILAAHGKRIGDLRVIAGVHHPSDVAAAQRLGGEICARLLGEEDFLTELEDARRAVGR